MERDKLKEYEELLASLEQENDLAKKVELADKVVSDFGNTSSNEMTWAPSGVEPRDMADLEKLAPITHYGNIPVKKSETLGTKTANASLAGKILDGIRGQEKDEYKPEWEKNQPSKTDEFIYPNPQHRDRPERPIEDFKLAGLQAISAQQDVDDVLAKGQPNLPMRREDVNQMSTQGEQQPPTEQDIPQETEKRITQPIKTESQKRVESAKPETTEQPKPEIQDVDDALDYMAYNDVMELGGQKKAKDFLNNNKHLIDPSLSREERYEGIVNALKELKGAKSKKEEGETTDPAKKAAIFMDILSTISNIVHENEYAPFQKQVAVDNLDRYNQAQAQKPLRELEAKKIQQASRKVDTEEKDFQIRQDPNSEISKAQRTFAEIMYPGHDFSNLNADQLEKMAPVLSKVRSAIIQNEKIGQERSERERLADPNSVDSLVYRQIGEQYIKGSGMEIPEGFENMSASQVIKTFPALEPLLKENTKLMSESIKGVKQHALIENLAPDDAKNVAQFKQKLPNLIQKKEEIERALQLQKELTWTVGPLGGKLPASWFITRRQELDRLYKKLSLDTMVSMFAGMSKAVDSDAERKFFEQAQPNVENKAEVNLPMLYRALNFVETSIQDGDAFVNFIQDEIEKGGEKASSLYFDAPSVKNTRLVGPTGELVSVSPEKAKELLKDSRYSTILGYGDIFNEDRAKKEYTARETMSLKKEEVQFPLKVKNESIGKEITVTNMEQLRKAQQKGFN